MDNSKIFIPKKGKEEFLDKTSRDLDREAEDNSYIPVIVKRNDESVRHPGDTLLKALEEGMQQYKRSFLSLFLSSMSAGLILGFAAMCVAIVAQYSQFLDNVFYHKLATALVYPLGFVICIMSGNQLFTEHTATAVYPVLDRQIKIRKLFKMLSIVLLGNLVGTFSSAILMYLSRHVIHADQGFIYMANHLISYTNQELFISAVLAGWLMAQGGWLVLSTPPASSQILCIYVVTFIIGFGGLHHSIAGSAEVFVGLLISKNIDLTDVFKFLFFAIAGNLLGGSFFVAVLNYAHIKKTQ